MTQGLITLIPKPNIDKLLSYNWCPIALPQNDYKIITSCIGKKLKRYLGEIIDESSDKGQSGFVTGRLITNNFRIVQIMLTSLMKTISSIFRLLQGV